MLRDLFNAESDDLLPDRHQAGFGAPPAGSEDP
jgi:hypothetical protein